MSAEQQKTGRRWDLDSSLAVIGPRIRRYLQAQAEYRPGITFAEGVEDVFDLEPGGLRRLAAAHIAAPSRVSPVLDDCDALLRRLPSTLDAAFTERNGVVEGSVDWSRTRERRLASGDPTLFVCRTTERHFQTPTGKLLKSVLSTVSSLESAVGVEARGALGLHLHETTHRSNRLLANRKLRGIRTTVLREPVLDALERRSPRHARLVQFYKLTTAVLDRMDHDALWSVVEDQLLIPRPDVLFELDIGFRVADALDDRNELDPTTNVGLIDGGTLPLASFKSEAAGVVEVWWQRSVTRLLLLEPRESLKWRTETRAKMRPASFRPDVLVLFRQSRRLFLLEVKHTATTGPADERGGIAEAMAYLADTPTVFDGQPPPHAGVVAWNASGTVRASEDGTWPEILVGDAIDVESMVEALLGKASTTDK